MKKIIFTLLGMLMITSASAVENEYVPLVREGVKWVEYYNNSIENIESLTSYQFDGQKEIGGNIYSMLYAANINDATQNNRLVAYVREQDKQIYIIPVDSEVYGCIISLKS